MPNELSSASVSPAPAAPAADPAQADPSAAQQPAAPPLPPILGLVAAGHLAAVTVDPVFRGQPKDALQAWLVDHDGHGFLEHYGLDYEEFDSAHEAIFNPSKVTAEQLQAAHKAGKLHELAPNAVEVANKLHDAAQAAPAPAAVPAVPPPADAPVGPLAGLQAPTQGKAPPPDARLQTARVHALRPAAKNAPNPVPEALGKRAL